MTDFSNVIWMTGAPGSKWSAASWVLSEIPELNIDIGDRTPERLFKFAKNAHKNYSVICAGAGRAAHLAGMCASLTKIPVIGIPIKDKKTDGVSALFSVAEMPNGIPVATTAINGALNAGLLAISIIALQDKKVRHKLEIYRVRQTKSVKKRPR